MAWRPAVHFVLLSAVLGLSLVLGAGCSGTKALDASNAGRTRIYQPGLPDFDMEVSGSVQDGAAGLTVTLGVPYRSLVFVREDSARYVAGFETLVRLLDERGKEMVREFTREDTVRVGSYAATQDFAPYLVSDRLPVAPGVYVAEVTVTDARSQTEAIRRQRVHIVAPDAPTAVLSRIRMEGRRAEAGAFEPIVSFYLPEGLDSVRAVVDLSNAAGLEDAAVEMQLVRFPSDTTIATPPHWLTPSRASLVYRGVRYDRPDTVQATARVLRNVGEEVTVEFALPALEEGVYRMDVTARPPASAAANALRQRRDFTVRRADFPRITHLDQLVDALAYLSREKEFEALQEAATPAEKKQRFDAFWGERVANRQEAANLLKRYYSRVEEANLFFSGYKEGWKTDRGMVYVVLGPPLYIDRRVDAEVWVYSYDERLGSSTYVFERIPLFESEGAFDNYVLQRQMQHDYTWSRALERWRRGEVM